MVKHELIDIREVYEITGGNEDLFRQMSEIFTEISPVQMENIKKTWAERDYSGLREAAHDIKSSASSLGAHPLYNASLALEQGAKNKLEIDDIVLMINNVEIIIEKTVAFFDQCKWPEME